MWREILFFIAIFFLIIILPSFMEEHNLLDLHWSDPKYIAGDFDPSLHPDFVKIDKAFADSEKYIQKQAYNSFLQMATEAKKEKIELKIISACRNFNAQKKIWEDKWTGKIKISGQSLNQILPDPVSRAKKIMEFTAPPGLSRHHWGTDIDLNSVDPNYFETIEGKEIYAWLNNHAHEFGFCQTYIKKDLSQPKGFEEEKWHWSYTPFSTKIWEHQIQHYKPCSLKPFFGEEAVYKINILEDYIKMVNQ